VIAAQEGQRSVGHAVRCGSGRCALRYETTVLSPFCAGEDGRRRMEWRRRWTVLVEQGGEEQATSARVAAEAESVE